MMLLTLFLADRAAKVIIARYKERFGFDRLSDIAVFSLSEFCFLFGVLRFIINPLDNWISRAIEHQADQFGLEITRDNHRRCNGVRKTPDGESQQSAAGSVV